MPDPTPPATDPTALLALAETLAVEAGRLVQSASERPDLEMGTKSSHTDLVTEVDLAVERLIVEGLRAARPGDGVRGEEGADEDGTTGVVWHIDPIDGTTNFVYGHPGYNVSIAAEVDGTVVAGAVNDVAHDALYTASLGGGARCNGRTIRCTDRSDLSSALVATGFSYLPERRRRQAEVLVRVLPQVRDLRRMGAAATDLCAVARGMVDAFWEVGLNSWDYAAGALVAAEAGARVGDLHGGPPSSEFCLAAPPAIFDELAALLQGAGAPGA